METILTVFISSAILLSTCLNCIECHDPPQTSEGPVHPVIHTTLGAIRGNHINILNTSVDVYWSIPFATPPTGELRFQPPIEFDQPWNGTLDGTEKPNSCQQVPRSTHENHTMPISEDCLYLNVFVPSSVARTTHCSGPDPSAAPNATRAPVLFVIHGGGFFQGSSADERYDGTVLAATTNVIVVTVNYRLGVFGFLYTGTGAAMGNVGIMDQLIALKWVHSSIECFGGDPQAVTIYGNSAGAISVGTFLMVQTQVPLFRGAVLVSGTPNMPIAFLSPNSSIQAAIELANHCGCNVSDGIPQSIQCLKGLPAELLLMAQTNLTGFRPVLAPPVITLNLDELYDLAAARNVTILLAVLKDDGKYFLKRYFYDERAIPFIDRGPRRFTLERIYLQMLRRVKLLSTHPSEVELQVVMHQYTNWSNPGGYKEMINSLGDIITDLAYVCPTNDFGEKLFKKGVDVYYFMFNHIPSISEYPKWTGVIHAYEMPFVFGQPFRNPQYTAAERALSHRIMKHLGNFATTGDPSLEDFQWPKYASRHLNYVQIDTGSSTVKQGLRLQECALWNVLLPRIAALGCQGNITAT